ncbi:10547_t:CDS:1, partial [Paraglomus occultum]
YKMFCDFKKAYYGVSEKENSNSISLNEFIIIDLRKQNERLKTTVQDITIKAEFGANVPANTMAYALQISDRMFNLQSDGCRFEVVLSTHAGKQLLLSS